MDEASGRVDPEPLEPADEGFPFDHDETPAETLRRLEAIEFWRNVEALERAEADARIEAEREAAYWDGLRIGGDVDNLRDLFEFRVQRREDALDLWRILHGLGCAVFVARGRLQIEPVHVVPAGLLALCQALPMRALLEDLADECDC